MNLHHLGEQIDIHGGGNDLIFPHHENEIAQTESLTGKPFARYWIHNGMLQLGAVKMSKSLGNLITIEEYLTEHSADSLRYIILNASYRSPLIYSDEVVAQAEKALERLRSALRPALPESKGLSGEGKRVLQQQMEASKAGFIETMDDDFNTAGALSHIFELVRAINQARADGALPAELEGAQALLRELTGTLGLTLKEASKGGDADPFVQLLVDLRLELRKQKLYALADTIRDRLAELGVILEDTREGTIWRWG